MRRSTLLVAAVSLLPVFQASAEPGNLPESTLDHIVNTYAGNFYRKGEAGGLSVAITLNGQVFYKSYGYRSRGDQGAGNAVDEHSIFEIGSVTKIWTTALVGQAVATGGLTPAHRSQHHTGQPECAVAGYPGGDEARHDR